MLAVRGSQVLLLSTYRHHLTVMDVFHHQLSLSFFYSFPDTGGEDMTLVKFGLVRRRRGSKKKCQYVAESHLL